MDRVCAIVVTYNAIKWIERCLQSLESSSIQVDYVIVDNDSKDETVDFIERNFSPIKVFRSSRNLGFGKANNVGLKWAYAAGYDYFFLVNQDVYVDPEAAGDLVRLLSNQHVFGVLSPLHLEGSGKELDYLFSNYIKRDKELSEDLASRKFGKKTYPVSFVNAACWMISKDTLRKVGIFHPLFFHYGEDDNYVQRLHSEGLQIGVVPEVSIRHDRNQEKESNLKSSHQTRLQRKILLMLLSPGYHLSFAASYRDTIKLTKGHFQFVKKKFMPWHYLLLTKLFIVFYVRIRTSSRADLLSVESRKTSELID